MFSSLYGSEHVGLSKLGYKNDKNPRNFRKGKEILGAFLDGTTHAAGSCLAGFFKMKLQFLFAQSQDSGPIKLIG